MNWFIAGLGRVSAQAGLLIFLVLVAQRLFKAHLSPKWRCILWTLPALRLLLPVSVSSAVSVFNLTPAWRASGSAAQSPAVPGAIFQATDRRLSRSKNTVANPMPVPPATVPLRAATETRGFERDPATFVASSEESPPPRNGSAVQGSANTERTLPPVAAISPSAPSPKRSFDWMFALGAIWLAGCLVLIARILFTCRELNRLLGDADEIRDEMVLDLFRGCADELEVRSHVRLVESAAVASPLLHGFLRPRLVLPVGLRDELSWDELRFVLLHELAHVKRRDILQNWLGTLLQCAHWFNPLVWIGFARWRADRELACDALALETAGEEKKSEYGRTILRLLEASPGVLGAPAMVGILEDKRQLRERISMIASFSARRRWSFLAMLLLLALGLAGLTDARRAVEAAATQVAAKIDAATPPEFEPAPPPAPKPTNGPAVKVVVANEAGQPVKGAKIMAPHQALFFVGQSSSPTWITDENGTAEIRLGELPQPARGPGVSMAITRNISIIHPDYAPVGITWTTQGGDTTGGLPAEMKTVLKKGVKIGGIVQDERGQPLPNVRVGVMGSSLSYNGPPKPSQTYSQYWSDPRYEPAAVTDASGRWTVENVPADVEHWTVSFLRPDGAFYSFTTYTGEYPFNQSVAEPISGVKLKEQNELFVLKDGWSVHGKVLDPNGTPVPNLLIREVYNRYIPGNGLQFRTDTNGKFELRNRQRRQLLLIALPEKYAMQAKIVDRTPAGAEVTFQLEDLSPLRIEVVDDNNRGIAGAKIGLDPLHSGKTALPLDLTAGADGVAVWTNAPLSDLALTIYAPDTSNRRNVRIKAGDKRDLHIQIRSEMAKEITISGKAVDADSGEPVKLSAVKLLTQPWSPATAEDFSGSSFRFPVRSDQFQQGFQTDFALQCEADGYATYTTERHDYHEGDWNVDVRMKRGAKPGGTLLLSDGTPAAGADVVATMQQQGFLFMNTPGTVYRNDQALRVVTDDEGKFELKDPGFDAIVLITHEQGFLETSLQKLASRPKLTLQPWGRIEGTLKVGTKPVANANINLSGHKFYGQSGSWNFVLNSETDPSGNFAFNKVPPGDSHLYRYFNRIPGPITETYQLPLTVKPGETLHVDYGGTGRPVIGQVEGNVDWKNDVHLLVLKPKTQTETLARPSPEDYFDPDEFQKAMSDYNLNSQKSDRQKERSYYVNFSEDGSFRADDIPAGTYELRIKVTEPPKPGENRYGPVGPDKTIASLTREVVVPEMPGGRSDEPLDLGVMELEWKRPQPTLPPVALSGQTLDGKAFSLDALKGKFVVLNFWTTWSDNSQEQMADVSGLSAKYKDDARVVFVGVNLGEARDSVQKRAKANSYTTPQVILTGAALARTTEALNVDTLPAAFLIGPNGRILSRDLKGDALERALEAALKRQSKGKE